MISDRQRLEEYFRRTRKSSNFFGLEPLSSSFLYVRPGEKVTRDSDTFCAYILRMLDYPYICSVEPKGGMRQCRRLLEEIATRGIPRVFRVLSLFQPSPAPRKNKEMARQEFHS
jgi:hypothetical protein